MTAPPEAGPPEPRRVVVRYRTSKQHADENQGFVEAVFAELAVAQPDGIRYATFRLDDGVTFVHVASIETPDGSNPLDSIAAFRAFGQGIAQRCEEGPTATAATLVGSYRLVEPTRSPQPTTELDKETR